MMFNVLLALANCSFCLKSVAGNAKFKKCVSVVVIYDRNLCVAEFNISVGCD